MHTFKTPSQATSSPFLASDMTFWSPRPHRLPGTQQIPVCPLPGTLLPPQVTQRSRTLPVTWIEPSGCLTGTLHLPDWLALRPGIRRPCTGKLISSSLTKLLKAVKDYKRLETWDPFNTRQTGNWDTEPAMDVPFLNTVSPSVKRGEGTGK